MEYIEIILENLANGSIGEVLYNYLGFDKKQIVDSHFFNRETNNDITFEDINDLEMFFSNPNTGTVYLKRLVGNWELKDVLLAFVFDEVNREVTINFTELQMNSGDISQIKAKCHILFQNLMNLYHSGMVEEIVLGYEPAKDMDMKVLSINKNGIRVFESAFSESTFAQELHKFVCKNGFPAV